MLKVKILLYSFSFLLFLSLFGFALARSVRPGPAANPFIPTEKDTMAKVKTDFFLKNSAHFNCVFIGDSRTYQAIDPQVFDHFLGTRSYNLGGAAHWFETQYSQLSDILPKLSPGTTVVWSIGHNNFSSPYGYITSSYPLHWSQALQYWRYGFSWDEMKGNILTYHLLGSYADWLPGLSLYRNRAEYYRRLKDQADRPLFSVASRPAPGIKQMAGLSQFKKVYREMMKNKGVQRVSTITDGNNALTGALIYKNRGVLLLMEIDPDYFLRKKMTGDLLPALEGAFQPDPRYLKLFDAILDLFGRYKVRVMVNEFEYAPYAYGSAANYERYAVFMKSVRERVEKRGILYVRVPRFLLNDDDYYDLDHLNYQGAEKYSAYLAEALRAKGLYAV